MKRPDVTNIFLFNFMRLLEVFHPRVLVQFHYSCSFQARYTMGQRSRLFCDSAFLTLSAVGLKIYSMLSNISLTRVSCIVTD